MNDERLLANAIKSNNKAKIEDAFCFIYNKYKPLVVFVASKYLRNIGDINDVVQDTFISFFNNIASVKTNIKSYLTVTVKNKAIDFIRKNKKIDYVDVTEVDIINNEDYYKTISNDAFIEMVDELKRTLGNDEANIIIMHLIENLDFKDIALKYNEKENSVKTRYYRALKKFKERNNKK